MIRKILMGLAAVVGFTTAATAATPAVVWDGDFGTASKTGTDKKTYTLTLNQGTVNESGFIVNPATPAATDKAARITWDKSATTAGMKCSVLIRYSSLADLAADKSFGAIHSSSSDGSAYYDLGFFTFSDSSTIKGKGYYNGYNGTKTLSGYNYPVNNDGGVAPTPVAGSGVAMLVLDNRQSNDAGCGMFCGSTVANLTGGRNKGLRFNNHYTDGVSLCGPYDDTTKQIIPGVVIEAVAIFPEQFLTPADVESFVWPSEVKEYYATLDGHVYEWTDLDGKWNPKMPAEGFSATDTLVITNEANQSFFMDKDVTALKLKFVSSPDAPALALTADEEEVSLAIGTYDFSEAESKTTIKYGMTASVVAGKDTVLEKANDPSLTIAAGNKLTVKYPDGGTAPTLKASKVSNAGTLHFVGGTAASPIYIDGGVEAGLGTITLAENTYVKQDDKETTTKYNVTGSGASSFFTVARKGTGAPGMKSGSSFADVIVGSAATASGKEYWLEHATIADTVGLNLTGNLKLSDLTPNPVVIRSLTGTYNLANNNGNPALTICCKEDANFAGTSGIPITIGEGEGTQTFSGAFNKALTVEEGGQVKLTGSAQPSSIAVEGVVYVDPDGAAKTITGAITGEGTIYVTDSSEEGMGSVAFTGDRSGFKGTIIYTRGLYDIGTARELDIPEGVELQEGVNIAAKQTHDEFGTGADTKITGLTDGMLVVLTKLDGTTETLTAEDGEVTFPGSGEVKIDGAATLFDVTFTNFVWDMSHKDNGFFSYKGVAGATLQYDTDPTFANTNGEAQVKDIGVYIRHHPYINGAASTFNALGDFTGVFVGEMSPTANRIFVYFGSSLDQNQGIMIATLAEKDAVGVFSNVGTTLTELTELSVPNAATARHVYIVTKKEVAGDTVFTIYLDGVKRAEKTIAGTFVLGTAKHCGVQVGSDFGGKIWQSTSYKSVDNIESETGVLNVCRIYDYLLTDEQVAALKTEYPYESEGGLYTRTIADAVDYAATAAWAKSPSTTPEYDVPTGTEKFSPSATLTASADAVVTVNTNSEIDVFTFNGSAMSFVKDAEGTNKVSVSTVDVNAPITIEYGALDLSKASVSLKGNGAVTFDLAKFPLDSYFASTKIQMTGLTDRNDTKITVDNIPESEGREAELLFEDGVYNLVITVTKAPFIYDRIGEGTGSWTWNGQSVTEETVSNNTAIAITKTGTGTLEWPVDRSDFTINDGTFKATAVLVSASSVTVNPGAVLDLNGNNVQEMNVVLNGGKVTNGGAAITGSNQIKTITLGYDSEINVPNAYEIYAANYNTATTIDLGEYTLTKTGEAKLTLVNTIISNGVFYVSEGLVYSGESTTFEEDATLKIGETGTWEQRNGTRKTTVSKIVGEGGTLKIEGQISNFTLEGTLTVTGNGTYGTITMAEGTVLNAGSMRNLVLAGEGTVNVVLTDAEIAAGEGVTVFTTESENITIGTIVDKNGGTVPCDVEGGTVTPTAVAKNGSKYYLSLNDAFANAVTGDEIVMLKNTAITNGIDLAWDYAWSCTLDMNGKTITPGYQPVSKDVYVPMFTVSTNVTFTIKGDGTITGWDDAQLAASYDGKAVIKVDGGWLMYENGTLTATGEGSDGMYGVCVCNNGTAYFGKQDVVGGPTITSWFAPIGANNTTPGEKGVKIIVYDGEYTQLATPGEGDWWHYFCAAIYAPADGSYDIRGGSFTGALYSISTLYKNVDQDINIYGGDFAKPLFVGEVEGTHQPEEPGRNIYKDSTAIKLDVVPDGYVWSDTGYLIKAVCALVKEIGVEFYYESVEKAFKLATNGDTVKLLQDATITNGIDLVWGEGLYWRSTLDLNGKTLSPAYTTTKENYDPMFNVSSNAYLTIIDSSDTKGGTIAGWEDDEAAALDGKSIIRVDGGFFYFESGKLTAGGVGSDGLYGVYIANSASAWFGDTNKTSNAQGTGPTIKTWFAPIGCNNTTPGDLGVTVKVYGGEYEQLANGAGTTWDYFCSAIYAPAEGDYYIYGGSFKGTVGSIALPYNNVGQIVRIEGGTFVTSLYVGEKTATVGGGERLVWKNEGVIVNLPAGYYWDDDGYLQKSAPTPGPEPSDPGTKVDPVPGEEGSYYVNPTEGATALKITGVKDTDTLIITNTTVTSLAVDNKNAKVKVMNKDGEVDITSVVYGWLPAPATASLMLKTSSANESGTFSTELDPSKVNLAVTGITPGKTTEIGVTSVVGLTYTLIRQAEIGGEETELTPVVATETTMTLQDSAAPAGQAFYTVKAAK